MTVHFDRLTEKPNCLTEVKVKVKRSNSNAKYGVMSLAGTPGHQKTKSYKNPLSYTDRCSSVSIEISTKVFSDRQTKRYSTHFSLNPKDCNNVKEKCSYWTNVDSIQSSTDKNNSTVDQEENNTASPFPIFLFVGGSGIGAK